MVKIVIPTYILGVSKRVEKFAAPLIQLHKSTSTENYKTEIDSLSLSLLGREEATSVTTAFPPNLNILKDNTAA